MAQEPRNGCKRRKPGSILPKYATTSYVTACLRSIGAFGPTAASCSALLIGRPDLGRVFRARIRAIRSSSRSNTGRSAKMRRRRRRREFERVTTSMDRSMPHGVQNRPDRRLRLVRADRPGLPDAAATSSRERRLFGARPSGFPSSTYVPAGPPGSSWARTVLMPVAAPMPSRRPRAWKSPKCPTRCSSMPAIPRKRGS